VRRDTTFKCDSILPPSRLPISALSETSEFDEMRSGARQRGRRSGAEIPAVPCPPKASPSFQTGLEGHFHIGVPRVNYPIREVVVTDIRIYLNTPQRSASRRLC